MVVLSICSSCKYYWNSICLIGKIGNQIRWYMSKVIGTLAYSKPAIDTSFDDYHDDDNEDDDDTIMYLLKSLIFHLLQMEKKS